MLVIESRAGHRKTAGSHIGENYLAVLSHASVSVPGEYGPAQRTISDTLDPSLPGSVMEVINTTTLALGLDTAGWSWVRLVTLAAGLEQRADVQG